MSSHQWLGKLHTACKCTSGHQWINANHSCGCAGGGTQSTAGGGCGKNRSAGATASTASMLRALSPDGRASPHRAKVSATTSASLQTRPRHVGLAGSPLGAGPSPRLRGLGHGHGGASQSGGLSPGDRCCCDYPTSLPGPVTPVGPDTPSGTTAKVSPAAPRNGLGAVPRAVGASAQLRGPANRSRSAVAPPLSQTGALLARLGILGGPPGGHGPLGARAGGDGATPPCPAQTQIARWSDACRCIGVVTESGGCDCRAVHPPPSTCCCCIESMRVARGQYRLPVPSNHIALGGPAHRNSFKVLLTLKYHGSPDAATVSHCKFEWWEWADVQTDPSTISVDGVEKARYPARTWHDVVAYLGWGERRVTSPTVEPWKEHRSAIAPRGCSGEQREFQIELSDTPQVPGGLSRRLEFFLRATSAQDPACCRACKFTQWKTTGSQSVVLRGDNTLDGENSWFAIEEPDAISARQGVDIEPPTGDSDGSVSTRNWVSCGSASARHFVSPRMRWWH